MKSFYTILKLVFAVIIVMLINFNPGCKDPHDFEPVFDSLTSPPEAPQLLSPPHDTVFRYDMWWPYPNDIDFEWTGVENPEYYELMISTDPNFPGEPIQTPDTLYTVAFNQNGIWYWKVRGYNRSWTWYTEWSETWSFITSYSPTD